MRKHTSGPWHISSHSCEYGSVVADTPCREPKSERDVARDLDEVNSYGGYLIAESIAPQNRPLIAAAPALYDACQDAHRLLTVARELSDRRMAEQVVALAAVRLDCVTRDVDGAETEVSNG